MMYFKVEKPVHLKVRFPTVTCLATHYMYTTSARWQGI